MSLSVVVGPLLFILHSAKLAEIAAQQKTTLHAFADYNQLHIYCQPELAVSCTAADVRGAGSMADRFRCTRVGLKSTLLETIV